MIAASLAAAAALVLPTTALAASTQIGALQGNTPCFGLGLASDTVQAMAAGPTYAVPSGGTSITSWSIQAGADTGPVALEVWTPTAPPLYTLVAITDLQVLVANSPNTFTLASPIAVNPGDLIGLRVEGPVNCMFTTGSPNDAVGYSFGATTTVGGTETMASGPDMQLDVAASVEVTTTPNSVPTSANQCKGGGWQKLSDNAGTSFKNQGDCVSFVATGGTNTAAGS